jgi:hypothetical protein
MSFVLNPSGSNAFGVATGEWLSSAHEQPYASFLESGRSTAPIDPEDTFATAASGHKKSVKRPSTPP